MSAVNLLTPILNGGIQNVNFVNGRVLAAEDLTTERAAALQRQRLMGQCVGDGVACGFEVTLSASSVAYGQQVVTVTAGVAVNLNGDVMQLASATDLTLAATLPSAVVNGLFAPCAPPQTQLTNPGVYILTVLPASGYEGQAPVTQLGSAGVATSCMSRFQTAGVQFRLAPVTLASTGAGLQPKLYALANTIQAQLDAGTAAAALAPQLSQLRNGLAHACFGTDSLAAYAANPFLFLNKTPVFGLIEEARSAGALTDCEVPLAVLHWTLNGVNFIDMWSARRLIVQESASEQWPLFAGNWRQDQLASMLAGGPSPTSISADSYLLYLPPAGVVPVTGAGIAAVTGTPSLPAVDAAAFFGAHASKDVATTDGGQLCAIMAAALDYQPVQLSVAGKAQLYLVWENLQAINQGAAAPLAMIFAISALPYKGVARFGVAKWALSRFAPRVI
jgi:hypothetical protein